MSKYNLTVSTTIICGIFRIRMGNSSQKARHVSGDDSGPQLTAGRYTDAGSDHIQMINPNRVINYYLYHCEACAWYKYVYWLDGDLLGVDDER